MYISGNHQGGLILINKNVSDSFILLHIYIATALGINTGSSLNHVAMFGFLLQRTEFIVWLRI